MADRPSQRLAVPTPSRRGLSRVEAAGYVGVSVGTFDRMVSEGRMPHPKRIYGRLVWDVRAVDSSFEALDDATPEAVNDWDSV